MQLFPAFPNAAAARGHKGGSQHARVSEQSPGAPLSPGIPAALGKLGLASPAQRRARAGLTHPSRSQSQEPALEGSLTHTHTLGATRSRSWAPPQQPGADLGLERVWPIIPRGNARMRKAALTCCSNGS